jgi:hypothetical protein
VSRPAASLPRRFLAPLFGGLVGVILRPRYVVPSADPGWGSVAQRIIIIIIIIIISRHSLTCIRLAQTL